MTNRRIGVLALQGAVAEHMDMIGRAGAKASGVVYASDLAHLDALIIPGGESTAISRLIQKNGLYDAIVGFAKRRFLLGTCAGLVLCATKVAENEKNDRLIPLQLMDMTVCRNGFGRQTDSFETDMRIEGIGNDVPGVFIRAPYIERVGKGVNVLAKVGGKIVMAETPNVLAASFHPELTDDMRVMDYFCAKIR
ncbi:pyridoxal 5'-phosphate synthase glutaminase subunit PdxT [Deltaproteobacteria bacterium]|nr:pyridoxal 5'-phosphate synthase glutaminase subunit PdxT [Deltaproteobacteria bacterium]